MARQSKYLHYQMSACTHWWSGFPPLLVRPGWAWTWLTAAASSLTHPEEKEEKEKKKLEQENVRWEGRGEGLFERQSGRGRETMSGCSLCSSARGRMEVSGRGLGWFSPRVSSMWLTHTNTGRSACSCLANTALYLFAAPNLDLLPLSNTDRWLSALLSLFFLFLF